MYDYDETKFRVRISTVDCDNKTSNNQVLDDITNSLDGKKILQVIENVYVIGDDDYIRRSIVYLEKR